MQQVIVTVDETGEVKVEAKGVKGRGCKALTDAIERAIGDVTGDRQTPEFTQQASQQRTAIQ